MDSFASLFSKARLYSASSSAYSSSSRADPLRARRLLIEQRRSMDLVADLTIVKSVDFVSRLMVSSCYLVKFVKFERDTFAHLPQHQLYILEAATSDSGQTRLEIHELSLQEPPARLIVGFLQEDLKRVLEKFKEFSCAKYAGRLVPFMWLKFGKVLLQSRSGSLEGHKSFMPREVEMMSGREFSKTFDNSVSEEKFSLLQKFAQRNSCKSWSKERYHIQVSDEARPDTLLWCVCTYSNGDEETSLASGESTKSTLTLLKVRLIPTRHMITDVACVGKSHDIRLMFCIKEYIALSEEESQDLDSCLCKASVDDTVKGGLSWPLGSKQSTSGRLKVLQNVHKIKEGVLGSKLTWSFEKCNRVEFKASSGRISYEVSVRPTIYHEFCKAREDRTVEELMSSVADVIHEVWEGCIES
ncbi:hypothetical protein GOP47_0029288 [Adiantum capillus-veneris]|nr:hypothetical protein GOP47_0029288 [Adiantum capillus-veneris]